MLYCLRIVIVFFIVAALGCNNKNIHEGNILQSIRTNLNKTENYAYTIQQRLGYAKTADSLAKNIHDKRYQLKSIITIGNLNYESGNGERAIGLLTQAKVKAQEIGDRRSEAIILNSLGVIYFSLFKYDTALQHYYTASEIFGSIKDSLAMAQTLTNIGIIYKNEGYWQNCVEATFEASNIFIQRGATSDLAKTYVSLGNALKELERYRESLEYHSKALNIFISDADSAGIAQELNNIGNVYLQKKEYKTALLYYKNSLIIKKKWCTLQNIATTIDNIGEVLFEQGAFILAENNFKKALDIRRILDKAGYIETSDHLAKLYTTTGQLDSALIHAFNALNISNSSPKFLKQQLVSNQVIYEIYCKQNQYKKAIPFGKKAFELKDSLFNTQIATAVSQSEVKYDTHQKERELSLSQKLQKEQVAQIKLQLLFICTLLLLLSVLVYAIFLLQRSNVTIAKSKKKNEILLSELNHRVKNNLQLITSVLQLQSTIIQDKEQKTLLHSTRSRIQSISIIQNLLYKDAASVGKSNANIFMTLLTTHLKDAYSNELLEMKIITEIEDIHLDINTLIPLGLIINELISNIYKYARPIVRNGFLKINFKKINLRYQLQLQDNLGYWDVNAYRQQRNGLGLFLIETLIEQLEGAWQTSADDIGTTHTFIF